MSEHTHHHDHEPTASECADFLERIVYFLDNELDTADCAAVRVHLDTCNPCLEKYDLQRTVKSVVARSCAAGRARKNPRALWAPGVRRVWRGGSSTSLRRWGACRGSRPSSCERGACDRSCPW